MAERVLNAPYQPCYYLMVGASVVGVLYWDDATPEDYGIDAIEGSTESGGWFVFMAERVADRWSLDGPDGQPDEASALVRAGAYVGAAVAGRDAGALIGLQDLPPERLPWRLHQEDES